VKNQRWNLSEGRDGLKIAKQLNKEPSQIHFSGNKTLFVGGTISVKGLKKTGKWERRADGMLWKKLLSVESLERGRGSPKEPRGRSRPLYLFSRDAPGEKGLGGKEKSSLTVRSADSYLGKKGGGRVRQNGGNNRFSTNVKKERIEWGGDSDRIGGGTTKNQGEKTIRGVIREAQTYASIESFGEPIEKNHLGTEKV